MVEIDTLFQTKTAKKNIPFGPAHTYIAYIRDFLSSEGGGGGGYNITTFGHLIENLA